MKIRNNREYQTGRQQKPGKYEASEPGVYIERDGILLHPECREGLFLNAHPSHWAQDEMDYREMGTTRDFGPPGRGRSRDSQVE